MEKRKFTLLQEPESFEGIIDEIEKTIVLDPFLADAYIELANIQIKNNQLELAQENLEKAESIITGITTLCQSALGKIFIQIEDFDQALAYAKNANEQDRTNLESYRFLGQAYQANGQILESLDPLLVYTTHSPNKRSD